MFLCKRCVKDKSDFWAVSHGPCEMCNVTTDCADRGGIDPKWRENYEAALADGTLIRRGKPDDPT